MFYFKHHVVTNFVVTFYLLQIDRVYGTLHHDEMMSSPKIHPVIHGNSEEMQFSTNVKHGKLSTDFKVEYPLILIQNTKDLLNEAAEILDRVEDSQDLRHQLQKLMLKIEKLSTELNNYNSESKVNVMYYHEFSSTTPSVHSAQLQHEAEISNKFKHKVPSKIGDLLLTKTGTMNHHVAYDFKNDNSQQEKRKSTDKISHHAFKKNNIGKHEDVEDLKEISNKNSEIRPEHFADSAKNQYPEQFQRNQLSNKGNEFEVEEDNQIYDDSDNLYFEDKEVDELHSLFTFTPDKLIADSTKQSLIESISSQENSSTSNMQTNNTNLNNRSKNFNTQLTINPMTSNNKIIKPVGQKSKSLQAKTANDLINNNYTFNIVNHFQTNLEHNSPRIHPIPLQNILLANKHLNFKDLIPGIKKLLHLPNHAKLQIHDYLKFHQSKDHSQYSDTSLNHRFRSNPSDWGPFATQTGIKSDFKDSNILSNYEKKSFPLMNQIQDDLERQLRAGKVVLLSDSVVHSNFKKQDSENDNVEKTVQWN